MHCNNIPFVNNYSKVLKVKTMGTSPESTVMNCNRLLLSTFRSIYANQSNSLTAMTIYEKQNWIPPLHIYGFSTSFSFFTLLRVTSHNIIQKSMCYEDDIIDHMSWRRRNTNTEKINILLSSPLSSTSLFLLYTLLECVSIYKSCKYLRMTHRNGQMRSNWLFTMHFFSSDGGLSGKETWWTSHDWSAPCPSINAAPWHDLLGHR